LLRQDSARRGAGPASRGEKREAGWQESREEVESPAWDIRPMEDTRLVDSRKEVGINPEVLRLQE
jgi:hypothetical protein